MKSILLGFAVVAMAAATSAFTTTTPTTLTGNPQWHYKLFTEEGEELQSNYEPASGTENCPGTTSVRCIIEAPDVNGQPDLLNALEISQKF